MKDQVGSGDFGLVSEPQVVGDCIITIHCQLLYVLRRLLLGATNL